jgi:hypothetical protein
MSCEATIWNAATELLVFGINLCCVTGGKIPVCTVMIPSLFAEANLSADISFTLE